MRTAKSIAIEVLWETRGRSMAETIITAIERAQQELLEEIRKKNDKIET